MGPFTAAGAPIARPGSSQRVTLLGVQSDGSIRSVFNRAMQHGDRGKGND